MDGLTVATWALAVFTFFLVLVTAAYTAVAWRGLDEARKTGAVLHELASSIAALELTAGEISSALSGLVEPLRMMTPVPKLLARASTAVTACVLTLDRQAEVTEELAKLYARLHGEAEIAERLTEQGKDWRKYLSEILKALPVSYETPGNQRPPGLG